jgi:o-succinylbenzoate---CoA ligase
MIALPQSARVLAALAGTAPAVIDGSTTWTWADLNAQADAVAASLVSAGVKPGGRVALLARSSAAAIAFLHGAGRCGAVVVPLNDRLAPAELKGFLEDVDVSLIVAAEDLRDVAEHLGPTVLSLSDMHGVVDVVAPAPPRVRSDTPAVIVGTSGTTGRAKGAVLTWGAISASADAWNWFLPPATGWLSSLSIAHVGGLGIVWRAALAGVPVVVPARADLAAQIATPLVSHVSLVAVQLTRLLDETEDAPPPDGLRAVLLGGGPVPPGLVLRALAAGWPVVPTYGMTETASGVTALATSEAAARPVSAGRPLAAAQIRTANLGPDGVGEIEARGPTVFAGYYGKAKETATALTPDGWFRTGDLGSIDADGYLTVSDRRLDLIVTGGENVYPAEVEAALLTHPAIADAGVVGRPDERWGAVPVAAIVLRAGAAATDDELRTRCAERLARFKVPVSFVRLVEIPRVGAGKLDRSALRELVTGASSAPVLSPAAQAMPPLRYLDRTDGFRLAYRLVAGPSAESPAVLILHSTLSSGWQLKGLARSIAEWAAVVLPDRRGSGASRLESPRPVALDEQAADAVALLDALGIAHVTVLAAAAPERVSTVVAYEPPLLDVLSPEELGEMANVADMVRAAHATGGAPAATRAFLDVIGGEDALTSASSAGQAALLAEGDGVLADVGSMTGARGDLASVRCPVTLATGDASEGVYARIADAAAKELPIAARVRLAGLAHSAPIVKPEALAAIVRDVVLS